MLEAWRNTKGEKPRLVHRLDRDTSGVLVVARTALAAHEARWNPSASARPTEDLLGAGQGRSPKREDKISTWLVKERRPEGDRMRVARHGAEGRRPRRLLLLACSNRPAQTLTWLEMEPLTGRTHQLRVHAAHIGHPIIGDPKVFRGRARTGIFPAASRTSCTCMRAASSSRIPMAA